MIGVSVSEFSVRLILYTKVFMFCLVCFKHILLCPCHECLSCVAGKVSLLTQKLCLCCVASPDIDLDNIDPEKMK